MVGEPLQLNRNERRRERFRNGRANVHLKSSLRPAALLCAAFLSLPISASAAGDAAPLPVPRPPELAPTQDAEVSRAETDETPLPPSRPPELDQASPPPAADAGRQAIEAASCLDRLAKLGVRAEPAPAIHNGACGAEHPVRVSRLSDVLELPPGVVVACPVAEALARWAQEAVAVEADRLLLHPLKRILIGTSYECRSQNRQAGAKLSEHAFANAVDVMGFEFEKRASIAIAPRSDESPEALFQAAVRTKACAYFNTVLGPGSDAAHANHLHLDLRERRTSGRMCQ